MSDKYIKRVRFLTQRAKPWHIIKPESGTIWCGAFRNIHDRFYATAPSAGDGIVCTTCEKREANHVR